MTSVPQNYRQVVLECIGNFKELTLAQCINVNLGTELLSCTQLKSLTIQNCFLSAGFAVNLLFPNLADLTNGFLPNLSHLNIHDTCLGQFSKLFECRRPNLTHVSEVLNQVIRCYKSRPIYILFNN